ncbi:MAG: MarR family winged helix-turn-helix transcriptional regulator [Flavobacteriales bacterium]
MKKGSIEEAIRQPNFKSEYQKLAVNIFYTSAWLGNRHRDLFKSFDLTPPQFNILRILRGQRGQPLSVNALIDRMIDKSSNASRIVDKLVEKKLVERTTCPNDRRQVEVRITLEGNELLSQLDPFIDSMDNTFASLSEQEAKTLNTLLDKLRQ